MLFEGFEDDLGFNLPGDLTDSLTKRDPRGRRDLHAAPGAAGQARHLASFQSRPSDFGSCDGFRNSPATVQNDRAVRDTLSESAFLCTKCESFALISRISEILGPQASVPD
jgi:hypothetical protein